MILASRELQHQHALLKIPACLQKWQSTKAVVSQRMVIRIASLASATVTRIVITMATVVQISSGFTATPSLFQLGYQPSGISLLGTWITIDICLVSQSCCCRLCMSKEGFGLSMILVPSQNKICTPHTWIGGTGVQTPLPAKGGSGLCHCNISL